MSGPARRELGPSGQSGHRCGGALEDPIYRESFEVAPVAMLLVNDERRLIEVNQAACELVGIAQERLLQLRVDDLHVLAGSQPSLVDSWQSFLRGGAEVVELELLRGDGGVRAVSLLGRANVRPGLHLAVLLDVSAQRSAQRQSTHEHAVAYEAAQRGRERVARMQTCTAALARARTLVEVAQVIVNEGCTAFGAKRGIVALVVEAGSAMEIVGIRGDHPDPVRPGLLFALDQATPMGDAIRTLEPQIYGSSEALQARFPALHGRFWSPYGALWALPLCLHKQALGALALSSAGPREFGEEDRRDLAAFARLCAWAIERARLFDVAQAERRYAEEANRVKDEFLAIVSHELRTPLQSMLGWATLARSGKLDPDALDRALSTIERNAHAQAKLVEDLLDVTRISNGKLLLNVEPTCPRKVIEAALDVVRPAADAKGVELALHSESSQATVAADPDRLQQIVWNLLSNAVKFTDRGGRVRVLLTTRDAAVQITVQDSGRGIEPSFLPHVYERFRQAETSKRGRLGLGLGLSIVKHLVELHGGTIEARSEGIGMGSSFTVRLPMGGLQGDHVTRASQ